MAIPSKIQAIKIIKNRTLFLASFVLCLVGGVLTALSYEGLFDEDAHIFTGFGLLFIAMGILAGAASFMLVENLPARILFSKPSKKLDPLIDSSQDYLQIYQLTEDELKELYPLVDDESWYYAHLVMEDRLQDTMDLFFSYELRARLILERTKPYPMPLKEIAAAEALIASKIPLVRKNTANA